MSGFDENPFGPPTVDNPFADPSVQQVTKQTSSVQRGLEDYNPFADQPPENPKMVRGASNPPDYNARQTQPAVMQPSQEEVPQYIRTQQPVKMTTEELQIKQRELERKAEELNRREKELQGLHVERNNWPPLPTNCCGLEPCFYQDINIEIPVDFQRVVRHLYYLWLFHTILMVANVIGSFALLLSQRAFTMFALSILMLLIFTPFSFLCWYRPGYKAFKKDSSFNFVVFFFVFFFQFLITVFHSIGIPDSGVCGLIIAYNCFDGTPGGIITGLITLIIALGFVVAAVMDLLLISKVHRIYRSSGASIAKAQAEFINQVSQNEHVRGAAKDATIAVATQLEQSRTPQSRY